MDNVLALQVVQGQCHLTEVEFDSILAELDTLLQVVAQVSSQQEVHHHEHVLLILKRVPGTGGKVEGHRAQSPSSLKGEKHAVQTKAKSTQTTYI